MEEFYSYYVCVVYDSLNKEEIIQTDFLKEMFN